MLFVIIPCLLALGAAAAAEMVSRVLKNKLRELLRAVKSTDEADNRAVIGHFLHLMMDPTSALWSPSTAAASAATAATATTTATTVSVSVMSQVREKLAGGCDIEMTLRARFPFCLDGEASAAAAGGTEGSGDGNGNGSGVRNGNGGFKLVEHLQLGALFVRVAQLAGLRFSEPFVKSIWKRHNRTSSAPQNFHGRDGNRDDDDSRQPLSLVSPQRILDSLISIDTIVPAPGSHSLSLA